MVIKIFTVLFLSALTTWCQLAVISGAGPIFPDSIDAVSLSLKTPRQHKNDSLPTIALPKDLYNEFRQNIDSTIHYVDAVRFKRLEISGNAHGPKYVAFLKFFNAHKQLARVSFYDTHFKSGLLEFTDDKYPYVVVFKAGLTNKLRMEYGKLQAKKG